MKKEKMCFSGQRGKKESALGMNSIKSVDIVSNHLTWTPEVSKSNDCLQCLLI